MTRTDALKGVYVARVVGLVAFGLGAVVAGRRGAIIPATVFGVLFLALLLSGQVQAFFWSELLAGLHELNRRDYPASKAHCERFLSQLRDRPWLKRLIWLGTSSYSLSAEAMALNNLGAAELGMGEVDAARAHLNQAIAKDPKCPLPYENMGRLVLHTGSSEDALPWLEKATALGLRGDWSDRAARASQRNNAELSTAGAITGSGLPDRAPVSGTFIVYLLNDEKTPLEFAVVALERTFGMTGEEAVRTAIEVDKLGRAACAGFDDQAKAQERADAVAALAMAHGHSLACAVESPLSP
jgi:ATP-dependent Clp protease adapter protein ClpS